MTFEEFYNNEHAGQVRRCYVMTRSAEDARDIVHEAMIEVYRKWSTIDRPGAYLNRAVLNRCRNRARHTKVSDRSMRLVSSATKTDRVDDVAESVAIDRLIARLPFNQRAALVLRFYGGATTDEIADALDCRPGSVGPWINRGLAALRKELR